MFDVGFLELVLLAVIAMVVIGPERLPRAARTVGQSVGKVRRFFVSMQNQLDQEIRLEEINRKIMEQTKVDDLPNVNDYLAKSDNKPTDAETGSPAPEQLGNPEADMDDAQEIPPPKTAETDEPGKS